MTQPTPTAYAHAPTPVHALQFDGTVPCLLAIFQAAAKDPDGAQVQVNFGPGGVASSFVIAGDGLQVAAFVHDWIVIPDDGGPLFVVKPEQFAADWAG